MEEGSLFTPDTHMAEAGRAVLADELATIQAHRPALLEEAAVTAVHETRKAIRRTYTAVKLFDRYFESGLLDTYRRRLRKIMRRLGRCRDAAVFLQKLANHVDNHAPLPTIEAYWQARKESADDRMRRYVGRPKTQQFLQEYAQFTETPGLGVLQIPETLAPRKVRYLAPILIYERLAAVRAYEDHLTQASLERLHRLRIQFKELSYTLKFFAPVLGEEVEGARMTVKDLQQLLGDLNDATVALRMLAKMPDQDAEVAAYRVAKKDEIDELLEAFPGLWAEFASSSWRGKMAAALSVL